MINAKEEFLDHVNKMDILCCDISKEIEYDHFKNYCLTTGYTTEDYDEFIRKLDFKYDNGYGSQNLFGTIWYKDGSWSERSEYDGSEYWSYKACPVIPDHVKRIDKEREEKLNKIL